MSEEQKPSQGRGRALRDQRLLTWMTEDFEGGFGKVVEEYWRELYLWACKLLESSGLTYMAEDAVQEGFSAPTKTFVTTVRSSVTSICSTGSMQL